MTKVPVTAGAFQCLTPVNTLFNVGDPLNEKSNGPVKCDAIGE